jgi:hypothetical protein
MKIHEESWQGRIWLFTVLVLSTFTSGCLVGLETAPPPTYAGAVTEAEPAFAAEPAAMEAQATTIAYCEDNDPAALTEFRAELEPYGTWVDDATYGTVWVPNQAQVGADFAPYVTGGQWALTEDGDWLWESTYPFGWVTFHYGRWLWVPRRGWCWIAGRQYAHAWVAWRVGYDDYAYVGWAPMAPSYYWRGGVAVALWFTPPLPYVFCHGRHVFGHHGHLVTGGGVREASQRTRPYAPANPSRGSDSGQHRFANPTRGPSLAEAQVPPDRAPKSRSAPHPRAWSRAQAARAPMTSSHPGRGGSIQGTPARMSREAYGTRGASTQFRSQAPAAARGSSAPARPSGKVSSPAKTTSGHRSSGGSSFRSNSHVSRPSNVSRPSHSSRGAKPSGGRSSGGGRRGGGRR